jgi:hypothetical protein
MVICISTETVTIRRSLTKRRRTKRRRMRQTRMRMKIRWRIMKRTKAQNLARSAGAGW